MRRFSLYLLLPLSFPLLLAGQEYGYTRYDLKEGLAGSVVHCMVQDKEGFLWFGTETGLSRFDGTHFKNYTQKDGLPDAEIIKMFADRKGRVWMSPYKKSICYYYKGKIHNQQNDTLLKKVHVDRLIYNFAEDKQGNILVQEQQRLHLIKTNGEVLQIDSIDGGHFNFITATVTAPEGGFWIVDLDHWYKFVNGRFILIQILPYREQHLKGVLLSDNFYLWKKSHDTMMVTVRNPAGTFTFPPVHYLNYCIVDDNHLAVCAADGAYLYDVTKPEQVQHLLPQTGVTNVLKDFEGNVWFSTTGKGVYRLNSSSIQNLPAASMTKSGRYTQQVLALAKFDSSILVAADKDIIYRLSAETGKPQPKPIEITAPNPWTGTLICPMGDKIFYASKVGVYKLSPSSKKNQIPPLANTYTKAMFPYGNRLYLASDHAVVVIDPDKFVIEDTLWNDRATSLFVDDDTVFFGALKGLFRRNPDHTITCLGDSFPIFKQRISGIGKDSTGMLWIATYGDGLVGFKDGRIAVHLNKQQGMTSDICRTLFIQKEAVWVGTDKGLNKIDLKKNGYPVQQFTTGDGLISDFINTLYVVNSKVFIGTSEGITFFDEQKIDRYSRCDLLFTDITISGELRPWDSTVMQIPHAKNNIRFDYVAISFKSGGDIRYRYRLMGLDSNWTETRETYLNYPTLPSGEYELQIQAINKFDVHSRLLTARFTIEKLLWEKSWFQIMAGIIVLGIMGLLIWVITWRIRKREQEKTSINKRIGELEQLARKAQMNPHFIFNSLNSIQQYVMDSDLAGANKFISGFSRLIRQTLDFSSRQEISLEEELNYLTNYLELEKDRLEGAFSWEVILESDLHPADHYLPPMILQPFVENSVRHGLRYRKDNKGKITIRIKKEHNFLLCVIEDNGIGRKAAQKLKSSSHIEYQSKGMSLTAERIAMLNENNEHRITLQIDDLSDERQNALGTRVLITFPIT